MAERRMFSKKIIDSARFIKMPLETQSLYFHLGVRADDDGIVEAFSVMRLLGASEDSLKVLTAKGFVTILNDDLVTHISDWKEHNLIRADRKIDSIYKDLLLRLIPDVELIEPKERADKKHNGQPMDVQVTSDGPHSIGKDSIGKDSIGEDRLGKDSADTIGISPIALDEWFKYKGSTYTKKGKTLSINFLKQYDEAAQLEIVRASIMNGWKGLFEPKNKAKSSGDNHIDQMVKENKISPHAAQTMAAGMRIFGGQNERD